MNLFTSLGGRAPWTATQMLLAVLLSCALLFGGTPNQPVLRIAVICLSACALAAWSIPQGTFKAFQAMPALSQAGIVLFPLVWMLQLVPLPLALWESLPGRRTAQAVFDLLGTRGDAHLLSLTPSDTLFGLVMILPGLAAFLAALTLDGKGRDRCIALFLLLAALSVFVGLAQMTSNGSTLNFYDSAHKQNLLGFFANRNHEGLMIAVAAVFAIYVIRRDIPRTRTALGLSAVVSLVAITAVVGTTSRAGFGLTLLGLVAIHLAMFARNWSGKRLAQIAGGLALIVLLAYLLSLNPVVERSLERFGGVEEDSRWSFWQSSYPLLRQYFPWGGGLGGFVTLYRTVETLDFVDLEYLNHAHNEYLELAIEAGLPGLLAVAVFGLALVARAGVLARDGWERAPFSVPAAISIVLVALHSVVDYPLRTQALAVLFGILFAFFLKDAADNSRKRRRSRSSRDDLSGSADHG